MLLESLEYRRMLSATVDTRLGAVIVTGTDDKEQIDVTIERLGSFAHNGQRPQPSLGMTVAGDDANADNSNGDRADAFSDFASARKLVTRVTVYEQGKLIARVDEPAGAISQVQVYANGSDDVVRLNNTDPAVAAYVFAGAGGDYVEATSAGGARGSEIFGGEGNDFVNLIAGKGSTIGHTAYGEAGNDTLIGSDLDDVLYGDSPDSKLPNTRDGNDYLYGGRGNDKLFGGAGADKLFGGAGDDLLDGGDDPDQIDGGDGTDIGIGDESDKMFNVENPTSGSGGSRGDSGGSRGGSADNGARPRLTRGGAA